MQRHWFSVLVCASVAGGATGCAPILPPAVMIASQAIDGISYLTTGKSGTDHILSAALEEDCAIHRVVTGGAVCQVEAAGDVATANLAEDPALAPGDEAEGDAIDDGAGFAEEFAEETEAGTATAADDSSTAPRPAGDSILPDAPAPSIDEAGDENLARVPVPGPDGPAADDAGVPSAAPGNRPADDESAGVLASPPAARSTA
jgi:hypothetical protein